MLTPRMAWMMSVPTCIPQEGCWSPVTGSHSGPGVGCRTPQLPTQCPAIPAAARLPALPWRKTTTLPQLTLLSGQHNCREALNHLFLQKASSAEVSPLAGAVTFVIYRLHRCGACFALICAVPGEHESWSQCPSRTDDTHAGGLGRSGESLLQHI